MSTERWCDCTRVRHTHGEYQMYARHGCRCLPCAIAASQAKHRYNNGGTYTTPGAGFIDRTGTVRRLHALLAIGWRHVDISPRLSALLGRPALSEMILKHPGSQCFASTATAVRHVYNELSMTPGPSQRNRNRAAKLGYLPPLAWDDETIDDPAATPSCPPEPLASERPIDEIAVEEATRGRAVHLTTAERNEAVRRLSEYGYSAREIAERLSTTKRSITRRRTAVRTETPVPPCGTRRAYRRHKRLGEPVDTACVLADREYSREHKRSTRASRRDAA